jgi:hypothetical protein
VPVDTNLTPDKIGASAVRDKYQRLIAERGELWARLRANTSALKDAVAAGRLFGVEITFPADIDDFPRARTPLTPAAPQASLFEPVGDTSIREAVMAELTRAGPRGIKAAAIRAVIEKKFGRELHYKTIGMTLYRLSEKGLVRRERLIWYYVPQGTKENPGGGTPGQGAIKGS